MPVVLDMIAMKDRRKRIPGGIVNQIILKTTKAYNL